MAPRERYESGFQQTPDVTWVIVADEDAEVRSAIAHGLEEDGYDVLPVATHAALFAALEDFVPRLLVVDVGREDGGGIELVRSLRALGLDTPIFLLAPRLDESVLGDARRAGATALFQKPFELDDLRTAIGFFALPTRASTAPRRRIRVAPPRSGAA